MHIQLYLFLCWFYFRLLTTKRNERPKDQIEVKKPNEVVYDSRC
uniref:Uncharacterized protein n=1 Tax=Ascaris lumbricoides TaxID=6252 RepID=A0A0M3IKF8_ASCLU